MSNNVVKEPSTTAFGDAKVESMTPIYQVSAQNGLLNNVLTVVDNDSSGTSTIVDGMYTVQTGVAADGLASILTLRELTYRAGQGALARLTGKFTQGMPNSQQVCGLITSENVFAFGFANESFGIVHGHNGVGEQQELTLTASAGLGETVTATIDGIAYNVVLTGGTTTGIDAFEVSEGLNAQVPNYTFTSDENTVVAQAVISGPQITPFLYSSAGTSVGAWVQISAGVNITIDFIPQASWNIDTRISSDPVENLDPEKLNVYQVQYQYLGAGAINFFIEDSESGDLVLVHRIQYANQNIQPSVSTPAFRGGWLVRNLGNSTNLTVQGGSCGLFIEGMIKLHTLPRTANVDALAIGNTLTNIAATRNRISFSGKVNRSEFFPVLANVSTQANKFAFFSIILNPVFAEPVVYSYVDKDTSITEITMDHVEITGGIELGSFTIVDGNPGTIRFEGKNEIIVFPGETLAMAAIVPSGGTGDCQAALTWQEDL